MGDPMMSADAQLHPHDPLALCRVHRVALQNRPMIGAVRHLDLGKMACHSLDYPKTETTQPRPCWDDYSAPCDHDARAHQPSTTAHDHRHPTMLRERGRPS